MAAKTKINPNNTETMINSTDEYKKNAAQKAYNSTKKLSQDSQQITDLLPMVSYIARKVAVYIKPPLTFEDMVSAGTVGLVKAANSYDPKHNVEFKTYAYIKIKGAILDELRQWSFVSANAAKQIKDAYKMHDQILMQTGKTPDDDLLAEKLGIPKEKLYEIFDNARIQNFVSMDKSDNKNNSEESLKKTIIDKKQNLPSQRLEKAELIEDLTKQIQNLPEKQRQVIILYYNKQLTMKQIAQVMEITEPRVSQLHSNAIFYLSARLEK